MLIFILDGGGKALSIVPSQPPFAPPRALYLESMAFMLMRALPVLLDASGPVIQRTGPGLGEE